MSETNSSPIGVYINTKLEKYKKEYEDDLIFQKLEQEAAQKVRDETRNHNGSTHCSSCKGSIHYHNSNGSLTFSSNHSFHKGLSTFVSEEKPARKLCYPIPKMSTFGSAKNSKNNLRRSLSRSPEKSPNIKNLESMSKEELIAIILNQK